MKRGMDDRSPEVSTAEEAPPAEGDVAGASEDRATEPSAEDRLASPEEAFLLNAARIARGVKVAEDLADEAGHVLARRGQVLDVATAERIHRAGAHTRLQLRLPTRIDRHRLRERFLALPERSPDVAALAGRLPVKDMLSKVLNRFKMSAGVVDLLTLLNLRFPEVFEETLLGAWLTIVLADEIDLPRAEQDAAFQASLLRDVGLLFVTPRLVDAEDPNRLGRLDRQQLRSHARISSTLAAQTEGVSEEAALAVEWHHARVDGTGYPPKPAELELPLYAQLVGFTDALAAARLDPATPGASLARMQRVLVLQLEAFHVGVLGAFRKLTAGLDPSANDPDELDTRATLVEVMLHRAKRMESDLDELEDELDSGALKRKVPAGSPVPRIARRLIRMMRESGHGSSEMTWWLKSVKAGRDDIDWGELIDVDLQQRAIEKELLRLKQAVEEVAPWTRREILGPELL